MEEKKRSFEPPKTPFRPVNAHQELVASCERLLAKAPPTTKTAESARGHGLFSGSCAMAYLFFRLSILYPDLEIQEQSCLDIARKYLESTTSIERDDPSPEHCGAGSEKLVTLALQCLLDNDMTACAKSSEELCGHTARLLETWNLTPHSNEWLFGRAGLLYSFRLVRIFCKLSNASTLQNLSNQMNQVVKAILDSPRPWTWYGKNFVGACHGDVGIITQIVLTSPEHAPALADRLSELLDLQYPSGNFPRTVPAGDDTLVQFCHGATGFVASLTSLLPYYASNMELSRRMSRAIDDARKCIRQRGLLTKLPCLCHGTLGSAIALESSQEMELFLSYTTPDAMEGMEYVGGEEGIDGVVSLWLGEAGQAWAWAVLDKGLYGQFIGYNDI